MQLPRIGITLGDAAGIGPEILVKLLAHEKLGDLCIPVVVGDRRVVEQAQTLIGATLPLRAIEDPRQAAEPGTVYLVDLHNLTPEDYRFGEVSAATGRAAGEWIERATALALEGALDAIVTNPIHKESFVLGGYGRRYAGHTEMLAALTGTKSYCMMLACGALRVCHVTTHVSLLDALTRDIKRERILQVIRLADDACRRLGIERPAIGVAGVNPHASEDGLFGTEEQREIIPAIAEAQAAGITAEGPVPADTLFSKAKGGMYDAVVAMYHDQGHIPVKLAGFLYDHTSGTWEMHGVNVTLGLPIIRTSVDHGTAFDKAGKGIANHRSLLEALQYAAALTGRRAP
ncbi:D-threonate 4-phosphate dehydrogenase [Candidatus Defluviicoccus seviourii]|uniref:D-threonate 4-phosphate dehydrogenase n=1 Tax=Candidatus Defluviicoccus seviourii TaxID=2565273 RepID=A0A564WHT8_9PROT|nr:D-threonate 4-phosphate dehydrogenase [Candidatus Defluviicoccus seviourii]